jgi:hypothetical protein
MSSHLTKPTRSIDLNVASTKAVYFCTSFLSITVAHRGFQFCLNSLTDAGRASHSGRCLFVRRTCRLCLETLAGLILYGAAGAARGVHLPAGSKHDIAPRALTQPRAAGEDVVPGEQPGGVAGVILPRHAWDSNRRQLLLLAIERVPHPETIVCDPRNVVVYLKAS